MVIFIFLTAALSYALGSFPTGYIAGNLAGTNVQKHGSGNTGATNVFRILGKKWGFTVFFVDAFKGFVAVRATMMLAASNATASAYLEFFAILAAAFCVVGHSFPVWLRFKGGKGVATSAGAILGVMPLAAVTIFAMWVLVFLTTRYVSLASIIAASTLPFAVAGLIWMKMTQGLVLLYFSSAMTALVIWRHRSNIKRLLAGTEPRLSRK